MPEVHGMCSRCGKCENCIKLKKVQQSCLACCGTPRKDGRGFNHAGDDVRLVWNDSLERYPCLAYMGCDGSGPHQDGDTFKYKGFSDNIYILCRSCYERMLIEDAARATEVCSEDDLEAHAAITRRLGKDKPNEAQKEKPAE